MQVTWQDAFVAATLVAGDTTDDALVALTARDAREVRATVAKLTAPRKDLRARALAFILTQVAADVTAARIA